MAGNPRLARPIGPAADRASFFASYAVEPFEEVRRQFFRLPSLPVRAAGKLLSPEAKAKLKEWRARQTDLVEQTGLKRQYDRERAGG